jgi:hypothetical protein
MGSTHSAAGAQKKERDARARLSTKEKAAIGVASGFTASSLAYLLYAASRRRNARKAAEPKKRTKGKGDAKKTNEQRKKGQEARIKAVLQSSESELERARGEAVTKLAEKKYDIYQWFSEDAVKLRYDLLGHEDKVGLLGMLKHAECLLDYKQCERLFQNKGPWKIYLRVVGDDDGQNYRANDSDKQDGIRILTNHIVDQAEQTLESMPENHKHYLVKYYFNFDEKKRKDHFRKYFQEGRTDNSGTYAQLITALFRKMMRIPKGCEMSEYQFEVALRVLDPRTSR